MATVRTLRTKHLLSTSWQIAPEDFFLLLAEATSKEKVFLLAHPEYALSAEEETRVTGYFKRRLKHEPIAYITGHKEFYGRNFSVTRDTLIPRPETELLVEHVLNTTFNFQLSTFEHIDIIDVGTGSGNIIITLTKELEETSLVSDITYHALDISRATLTVAMQNAALHGVKDQITFLHSDLLQDFPLPEEKNHHAVITANLPYLSERIYHESDPDVRDYEPKSALESGQDGLDHYRRLLGELAERTKHYQSLTVLLEISPEQSDAIREEMFRVFPGSTPEILPDLSGRNRLVQASF